MVEIAYEVGDGQVPQPRDYHHPYQPYDIQVTLMDAIYDCIQEGRIGIFESPTGTLHGHIDRGDGADDGEPQWVIDAAKEERKQEFLSQRKKIASHLENIRKKEEQKKRRYERGEPIAKRPKLDASGNSSARTIDDEQFMLNDYESDDEGIVQSRKQGPDDGLSAVTRELLLKLGMMYDDSADQEVQLLETAKILYCSRTHSQLIQFANEVRRVKMPPIAHTEDDTTGKMSKLNEDVKHLALGSRKNLCINPTVQKLGSTLAINEKCLQLQQSKSNSGKGCQFLPKPDNETLVHEFRDYALARIRDIEELALLGTKIGICPYYASRAAIKPSELVTLPYPLMLQKTAREALDISLENHVVVIDEAHNLIDALSGIYSVTVSQSLLQRARAQLGVYLQKFRNKLKGKNRVYLAQLLRVIDSLIYCLRQRSQQKGGKLTAADLLAGKGADQINLHKLAHYVRESKLARKVDGYIVFSAEQQGGQSTHDPRPALSHVESFFDALTSPSAEGQFFFEVDENKELLLKYLLLDSAFHFREVVEQARSVILLGGTMSPMDDYINQLFPYVDKSRIKTMSCGHVIPKENLLALPVTIAANSTEFEFTFDKRSKPAVIDALGDAVLSFARFIPDGLVVFFPSYGYLEEVTQRWRNSAAKTWDTISAVKPIFSEAKGTSNVDDVLSAYSAAIEEDKGALLLSVVGGKMSEGINFSDRLGRGVVVVGLPFPNAHSVEWQAKTQYLKQQAIERGASEAEASQAARSFYENACMRAVNQSIGRAIRHRGDYACIALVDRRYATPRIQDKLPGWIQEGLDSSVAASGFGAVEEGIRRFFAHPRT